MISKRHPHTVIASRARRPSAITWLVRLSALLLLALGAGCGAEAQPERAPETPGAIRGELEVFVVTFDDGRSEKHHVLVSELGERLELDFVMLPPMLATGDRVVVLGERVGDRFRVTSLEFATTDDEIGEQQHALTGNAVTRRSKLAVLLVRWGTADSQTQAGMRGKVFTNSNSTAAFYKENSFNLFELSGDVFGWYQIAAPSGCDTATIGSRARAAAQNAGVNISGYNQFLYYFPRTSACGWSGLAYVGTPTSPARDTWYNGSSGCVVLAQELLHNFGAQHSRSYRCGGSTIAGASSCTYSEYGDPFDPMGGGCYHINVYQKAAQGWFGRCNNVTATADGTFDIAPTEAASDGIQSLRLPAPSSLCPSGVSTCYYMVEYRQPVGVIEGGYSSTSAVYNGVLVHLTPGVNFSAGARPSYPYLLDMNPGTTTFSDAALGVGRTFTDPTGIKITLASRTSTSARIQVQFPNGGSGSPLCIDGTVYGGVTPPPPPPPPPSDTTKPTVTQDSPADGATLAANTTIQVSATITDNVAVSKGELLWTNGTSNWTVDCAAPQSPFTCTQSAGKYTWSIPVGSGTRTWAVRGTDTSGNVTTSATRTINLGTAPPPPTDNPPVVIHVSPAYGATLPANSTIQVVARITDETAVSKGELLWYNNGNNWTVNCAAPQSPFACSKSGDTYTWSIPVGTGERWWRVRGTDSSGKQTTSSWSQIRLQ